MRIEENVPQFKLPPLESGREYQIAVYAVNAKGRSENYIFDRVRVGSLVLPYGTYHHHHHRHLFSTEMNLFIT